MKFDPRRALVGLAMAGSLIIMPPAVGYAVGLSHGGTVQQTRTVQTGAGGDVLKKHANDNAAHVNDNVAPVNDNVNANDPGAYHVPPIMPPSGYNAVPGQDDDPYYQYHNDPNNN